MTPSNLSTPTTPLSSKQKLTRSSLSTPSLHHQQETNPRHRRESLKFLERFQSDEGIEPLNSLTLELVPDIDPPSPLLSNFKYPHSLALPLSQTTSSIPPSPFKPSKNLISPCAESSFFSSCHSSSSSSSSSSSLISPFKAQATSLGLNAPSKHFSPSKVHVKPSIIPSSPSPCFPSSTSSISSTSLSSSTSNVPLNDVSASSCSTHPRRRAKPSPFFYGSDSEDENEDLMKVDPSLRKEVELTLQEEAMCFSSQTSTSSSSSSSSSLSQTPTLTPASISIPSSSSSSKIMTLEEALDSENEHEDHASQVHLEEDERIAFDPDQTIVPGDIRISILSPSTTSLSHSIDEKLSSSSSSSASDISSTFLSSSAFPTPSHSYHRIQALKQRFEQLKKAPLFSELPSTPQPLLLPSSSSSYRPELHAFPLTPSHPSSTFPSSSSTPTTLFPLSSPTPSHVVPSSIHTTPHLSTTSTTPSHSFVHVSSPLPSRTPSISTSTSAFSLQRTPSLSSSSILPSQQHQQQHPNPLHSSICSSMCAMPTALLSSTSSSSIANATSTSATTATTDSCLFSTPPTFSSSTSMTSSNVLPKPSLHPSSSSTFSSYSSYSSSSSSSSSSLPRPTTFSGLKPPSLLPIPTPILSSLSSPSFSSIPLAPPSSIPISSSTTTARTGATKTDKSIPHLGLPKLKSMGFKYRPPSSH